MEELKEIISLEKQLPNLLDFLEIMFGNQDFKVGTVNHQKATQTINSLIAKGCTEEYFGATLIHFRRIHTLDYWSPKHIIEAFSIIKHCFEANY